MEMQEALDRCEFAIRHQQDEIARLRAELERRDKELTQLLDWINGDSDSLTTLQRIYMDPRTSTSDRIRACGAAIGYERYKLTLAVSARSSDVLGDMLDEARALKTVNPKVIEHDPPSGP
jgi:chromosome segregation ATPase